MSYLVIARKWRPQTFEEVVGQSHVTRTLQNAVALDRIAHAYLFTGARGVGKTSIARILAKALNCEKGPTPSPCNQCSNCREIARGNSVDVLEIDGASNRGIDNIRELRETVRYRPAKGRFKVYIIDEVHMLTPEAFNALLKTLEEPPPHVIFLFATTEPHKIPATILSRCQRFDFRRLALPQLVDHLKRITGQEGARFSDAVLYAIAREADGSMRDAQSLLEQLLAFSGDGLADEEILDILGVIDRTSVLRAGEAVLAADARGCLALVDDLYRRGIDSRRFCLHLCDHFRNLLFFAVGGRDQGRLDLPEDEKEFLKKQAAATTPETLHLYFQMLLRGEEDIRRSSVPKIALEMLLLRMARIPRLESLDAVLERIGMLERVLGEGHGAEGGCRPAPRKDPPPPGGPAPSPLQGPPAARQKEPPPAGPAQGSKPPGPAPGDFAGVAELPPPDPEHFLPEDAALPSGPPPVAEACSSAAGAMERWSGFVRFLENQNPMLWAKVAHCGARAGTGQSIELEVPEIYEKSANAPDFLEKLGEASSAFFGCNFEWVIIKRDERKTKGASTRGSKSPKASGRPIVNHPAVQQAIEILGAELVEVKPFGSSGPGGAGSGKKTDRRH